MHFNTLCHMFKIVNNLYYLPHLNAYLSKLEISFPKDDYVLNLVM